MTNIDRTDRMHRKPRSPRRALILGIAALLLGALSQPALAERDKNRARQLVLINHCHLDLEVAVLFSPSPDVWRKAGWYTMESGEYIMPYKSGEKLLHRDNARLVVAANKKGNSDLIIVNKKKSHEFEYKGERLKGVFSLRVLRGPYVESYITC
ncbi:hypothetical protein ACM25N_03005 [Roseovarius sp. C7]|uniref:hypothetical protein n=1 Tax=Roseovarius sp. C7 TaxID=3398643 RepID=UPI0039F51ED1